MPVPHRSSGSPPPSVLRRVLETLRPSHAHSAFTATLVLTAAAFTSKLISLVRGKFFLVLLGRGADAEAFNAMFQLPDMVSYFLVGGVASITLVTMLTQYREEGREAEADALFSVVFTVMTLVMVVAVGIAEWLTPAYARYAFPGFLNDPGKFALLVHLTRIILPGQIFFFCGVVFSALLVVRKEFTLQAFSPLIYNLGMIVGPLLLFRVLGVSSMAWGALAGVILGPFLINGWGARRAGMRLRFSFDLRNPGLHEWFRKSLPLMLGVSLVSFDIWIINHFASTLDGGVTLFANAKQLFSVPQMLGLSAGQASLPFLAVLASRGELQEFGASVNDSVSRIVSISWLMTAWLAPMGGMAVDLYARGGHMDSAGAVAIGAYFSLFSLSLCFWSAQALYVRAFYATGDTLSPMVASTLVVAGSLPIYWVLFHWFGGIGLAYASDIGIALQMLVNAVMLHRRGMVPLGGLDWPELGRTLLACGVSAGVLFWGQHIWGGIHGRVAEALLLLGSAAIWLGLCFAVLRWTGSALPSQLARKIQGKATGIPA